MLSQLSVGDSLTISNLAQSQQLATSSMAEVVAKLAAAGLVTKTASSDDRREVRVSITKQGQRHLAAALQVRTELLMSTARSTKRAGPPQHRRSAARAVAALGTRPGNLAEACRSAAGLTAAAGGPLCRSWLR